MKKPKRQKIERGIYANPKIPGKFFCQLMVRGQSFYKSCDSLHEAQAYKQDVINKTERKETDIHPLVLREDGRLVLEVTFQKFYADDEEGRARAKKIATILDGLMDEG